MELNPHETRVIVEQRELLERIKKLDEFIAKRAAYTVDALELERLKTQLDAMQKYNRVLLERIGAFLLNTVTIITKAGEDARTFVGDGIKPL